jgi:hypothetical protein
MRHKYYTGMFTAEDNMVWETFLTPNFYPSEE